MELFLTFVITTGLILIYIRYNQNVLKPMNHQSVSLDDFCIIDIRDYISSYRSPYPGAENIPLSYLPRELKERFDCPKQILLVTDDKRGAKMAARMIRKKKHKSIYYIQS
ncbi:rhodanese-like domain-containing protein [Halobacillus fulvus]|nr:rhodanese-like domain-containing protein [Halobacillus fulvus]